MAYTQFLPGILLALAVLIGSAVALSAAIFATARVWGPGQAPHGGIRRDLPEHPQPDVDDTRATAEDRVLVLR